MTVVKKIVDDVNQLSTFIGLYLLCLTVFFLGLIFPAFEPSGLASGLAVGMVFVAASAPAFFAAWRIRRLRKAKRA